MPHVPTPVAISASAEASAEKPASTENDRPRPGALKKTFYEQHGPNGEVVRVPLSRNPARPGGAIDNILEKPSVSWNPKCPLKRITISPNPEWKKRELQPPERSHITGTKKAKIVDEKPSSSSSGKRASALDARGRDRSILRLLDI